METPQTKPPQGEMNIASLLVFSSFTCLITGIGFILAPIIVWLFKRDEMPYVDAIGKEFINFQLSWMIWMLLAAILILVIVGIFLLIALAVTWAILTIVYGLRAANGEPIQPALTIQFLR